MNGYIKLFRKFKEWGWYKDPNTKAVFIELLLRANYTDGEYRGVQIKAGQAIFGRNELAEAVGLTPQNVKTAINHLKSTNEITTKSTNKFSVVTIEKWAMYQMELSESTSKVTGNLTNDQPATNQQLTTSNKERKKEEKELFIKENRESNFYLNQNREGFASIKAALMKGE